MRLLRPSISVSGCTFKASAAVVAMGRFGFVCNFRQPGFAHPRKDRMMPCTTARLAEFALFLPLLELAKECGTKFAWDMLVSPSEHT